MRKDIQQVKKLARLAGITKREVVKDRFTGNTEVERRYKLKGSIVAISRSIKYKRFDVHCWSKGSVPTRVYISVNPKKLVTAGKHLRALVKHI